MKDISKLKVAIVHDWLVGGGAERVVLELHHLFPEAPIYTSYCSPEWRQKLDGTVVTGWLQHFGSVRKFLPVLRQRWFKKLDLSAYDLVISSSGNGEAKFVNVRKPAVHICYCHSPTHYYWRHYDEYVKHPGFGFFNPLARLGLKVLVGPLRKRDLQAAQSPDYFIANSAHIQADIKNYYGRDSIVIHPPVDIARFELQSQKAETRSGFVTVGRQVPYKHTNILVAACTKLSLPFTVIGRGPEHDQLVKIAGPTIKFLTDVSDTALPTELSRAEAFLFAAYEDFGVSPIEALATGTPVIAYQAGGALDYVKPGVNGEFFTEQTVDALIAALENFSGKSYSAAAVTKSADSFSAANFDKALRSFIESVC